jgi:ribosomal protein L7Ae-like RNA K-turn-binding protein
MRKIKVIVGKIKALEVNKLEETATGVDRAIKTTAAEIDTDHMTRVLIALDTTPPATIATFRLPQ